MRDLSLRLGERFDTVVLVPRAPGVPICEQIGNLRVERFPYFPRRWERLAQGAILDNLRARPSLWLQVLPFYIAETFHLRRLVRRHRPDVLHVHWLIPQGVTALAVARDVPWVVTTLGGDVYALHDPISRWLKRSILRRAKAVTTMNADMRDKLIEAGADPATIYVQLLGADIGHIREIADREMPIPGRIVFIGRLAEKKGVAVLIDAARQLPGDIPWSLEIVGDGPLRDELARRAEGLPITFSGAASREQVAGSLGRSAVAVVPSVPAANGDQEGLPHVLLEAMGAGRPVIASDLPGLDEAVEHLETGILVPPNDVDALSDALRNLLTDESLRERLGKAASRWSDDYTVEACSERFVDILTTAAAASPRPVIDGGVDPTRAGGWRSRISDNRRRIDVELADDPAARMRVSPLLLGLTEALVPRLRTHARGRFLDAGCGTQPFRSVVEPNVDRYLTYDIEARVDHIDFLGSIEDMGAVPERSIDSILCSEVLEHVPHPDRAVREFARILEPGGTLLLTVPFLARLHEEPHDYFRYTRHGLRELLDEAGFDVDEIVETGSIFGFLGHQVSVAVLGLTWHRRRLRRVTMALNRALVVRPAAALDRLTGGAGLLPLGYVAVATRRSS